ncbi:MAG: hypothetical protein ABSC01_01565 [Verrucomicrobiota bacterium]|jgi:hypothetical protein
MFLPFVFGFGLTNRKPAIDGQSRVSEICRLVLQFRSHAAQKTGVALPNAHATGDWRVLQCFRKHGFHILPARRNTILPRLSKSFLPKKNSHSQDLSPGRTVVN